ncbi:ribosomal protein S18-alanine N-acetyltransferase [soil metagenome]|jgi:ribosomal-protein-alanine N-acetyltransferase
MELVEQKTQKMQVRKAQLADLADIFTIEKSLFENGSYPIFVLRQFFDISPGLMWVAEADGQIVGYGQGNLLAENLTGWVLSLGVLPFHQGKGIGEELMSALLTVMTRKGAKKIYLTVHPENAPALKLYHKLGFEEEQREEDYYFTFSPRIRMVRRV